MGENEKKYNETANKLRDKIDSIEDVDTRYRFIHDVESTIYKTTTEINNNSPKIKEMLYELAIFYLETAMRSVDSILECQNSIRNKK